MLTELAMSCASFQDDAPGARGRAERRADASRVDTKNQSFELFTITWLPQLVDRGVIGGPAFFSDLPS